MWIVFEDGYKQLCPLMWFDLVENYTYYMNNEYAFDSLILYHTYFKKIRLVLTDNKEIVANVDLYESEYDSDFDMACIGLSNGFCYKQDDIRSIELIKDS